MPAGIRSCRVAIAGATSLRGKELNHVLEDRSFPADEIRLLDEDLAAGTLTEVAGEPALIQAVDDESFERVQFVFFAGSPTFAARHWETARRAGANVIDLSGGLADVPSAMPWIPALDALLPRPAQALAASDGQVFRSPSVPAIVACSLAAALAGFSVARLALIFFQPVSERGQAGIEELENQTVKLLSFQPMGQELFGAQVAFNLLDRYGAGSVEKLCDARASIAREVRSSLGGHLRVPAIQLIQAPVFYSYAFAAYAELGEAPAAEDLHRALETAGLEVSAAGDPAPTNVSVAGESHIVLSQVERDPNAECGHWFWGAADNLRVAAANAVLIAEKLLAS